MKTIKKCDYFHETSPGESFAKQCVREGTKTIKNRDGSYSSFCSGHYDTIVKFRKLYFKNN